MAQQKEMSSNSVKISARYLTSVTFYILTQSGWFAVHVFYTSETQKRSKTHQAVHPKTKCHQVCNHMLTKINTQKPQRTFHLSVDRRNTPATSSQSAFHHSVTTCQLQSPSLCYTALIFTNCAATWDATQPCQKYNSG